MEGEGDNHWKVRGDDHQKVWEIVTHISCLLIIIHVFTQPVRNTPLSEDC